MCDVSFDLVRRALAERDPLPGTAGFADELGGRPVRDILGRQSLFSERADPTKWSFDHRDLDDPVAVPTGRAHQTADKATGNDKRVWSFPDPPAVADRGATLDHVRDVVFEPVRSVNDDGLAVTFSSGVDSAVVAADVPDASCYVVDPRDSHDVTAAREVAVAMDRDLTVVEPTHEAFERVVPKIVTALG